MATHTEAALPSPATTPTTTTVPTSVAAESDPVLSPTSASAPTPASPLAQAPASASALAPAPAPAPTQASPSTSKTIVVIGGSYAGLSTAHYLLKHVLTLPALSRYTLTLVSASSSVICRPTSPRAMISEDFFDQKKLFVDIPPLFNYAGSKFSFVHGKATAVDVESRRLTVQGKEKSEEIEFGALVVATGSSSSSPLLGLQGDYLEMKEEWDKLRKALPRVKRIVIAGGGPAGIETAAELAEFLNGAPGWKTVEPKVKIEVITAGDRVLPDLPPKYASATEDYLAKMGVVCRSGIRVVKVEPPSAGTTDVAAKCVVYLDHKEEIEADLYIPTISFRPNTSFLPSSMVASLTRKVQTDQTLRIEGAERMYSVGDCANYARPAIHLIFPAIPIVCHSIRQDLLRLEGAKLTPADEKDRLFSEETRVTQLVALGKKRGLGTVMGFKAPSWFVWAVGKSRNHFLWATDNIWSGKQFNSP